MSKGTPGVRFAELDRETKETHVNVVLDIDGGSRQDISTGVGFFDHMLELLAFHGMLDVGITAEGDLHVDDHHTVEDVGIVLGRALRQSLVESEPIVRYADNVTPMDESLVQVALDVSGRGGLHWDLEFKREAIGDLSTECIKEFFSAMTTHAGFSLHVRRLAGSNDHHLCEAVFKAVGRAIHVATRKADRRTVNSTKGKIG